MSAKVETNGHHYDGGDHNGHLNGTGGRFIENIGKFNSIYKILSYLISGI